MSAAAPLSGKVTVGSLSGAAVGMITAVLVSAIPAWHSGLPSWLIPIIPVAVTVAGHFIGGYLTRHRATIGEVTIALIDAAALVSAAEAAGTKIAPPVGKTSPAGGAT